ncbi:type III secretion system ATPase [Caballeronia fortuita]|uniref:Type III secretion system ATPase n=1 Tax=Caballeronia fortuita TaxID=1777138 RepID=A0A158BBF5_9BURK|nr:FliI/YscN family ATPase [Caballeronia fortuita]SAK67428.1 type III secretion system ATPase [Caballeronia fortuita]
MNKSGSGAPKPAQPWLDAPVMHGRVVEARGVIARVVGASLRIGEKVRLVRADTREEQIGEVIGFGPDGALVMPFAGLSGLSDITRVEGCGLAWPRLDASRLGGRVLDGLGNPLDGGPPAPRLDSPAYREDLPLNPLERPVITHPFVTGVRAIDGLITCGIGQRVGISATAGGGKSTLMGMIANHAQADFVVAALIGERGREVSEFVQDHLREQRSRVIVIASTSDRPAAERIRASQLASGIASTLRAQGKQVLLLFDSLTRFARALREVGLAVGEPPARRGYPPRVFAELPRLIEMGGLTREGSVTAFFTVLAEDEDLADPIVEEARSLLDGHIQLAARLGAAGQYPAIDVLHSKSRLMTRIARDRHRDDARRVREWLARYQDVELLLQIGEYRSGADAASDRAIERHPRILDFLRQDQDEYSSYEETLAALHALSASAGVSP